eukprot:6201063-Pleurochrysis_carterae.AAC.8
MFTPSSPSTGSAPGAVGGAARERHLRRPRPRRDQGQVGAAGALSWHWHSARRHASTLRVRFFDCVQGGAGDCAKSRRGHQLLHGDSDVGRSLSAVPVIVAPLFGSVVDTTRTL